MSTDTTPKFPERPWREPAAGPDAILAPAQADTIAPAREAGVVHVDRQVIAKLLVVLMVGAAFILGIIAQDRVAYRHEEGLGVKLWLVALLLFVAGLWQARGLIAGTASAVIENPVAQRAMSASTEAVLFAGVMIVAVFFRIWRLNPALPPWTGESIPPGLNHDAAYIGIYGIKIHQDPAYTWFFHWWARPYVTEGFSGESIFHYLVATSQLIFGNTYFAIQFPSIVISIATVAAFYFFMRRVFDVRLALISSFLLAVSGWHYTLSKVGWPAILVPLFVCLIFYFLIKAIQEGRMRDWALAGIFLGLGMGTYNGARIVPFIVGIYLLYEIVRNPSIVKTYYKHVAAFAVCAIIAYAPLGIWGLQHWDDYQSRATSVWIGDQIREANSWEPLWINIKNALLLFNYQANGDDFFLRDVPLLDMPVSVFFAFGVVLALLRIRQRPYFLLVTILVLILATGVASRPNGHRNMSTIIVTSAFAGLFLFECWRWLCEAFPRAREGFTMALAAALIFTGWASYDNYLGPSVPQASAFGGRIVPFARHDDQWGFYPETSVIGRYMKPLGKQGYAIHVAAGNWPRDALAYLSYPGQGDAAKWVFTYTVYASELASIPPQNNTSTAYIIENTTENETTIQAIQQRYPSARTDEIFYRDGIIAYGIIVPPLDGEAVPSGPTDIPGAATRDEERVLELEGLVDALTLYRQQNGGYPDTGNNLQTACVYQDLDTLCAVGAAAGLTPDQMLDPRGDGTTYGYWYRGDNTTYTLFALFEGDPPANATCSEEDKALFDRGTLACVTGVGGASSTPAPGSTPGTPPAAP